MPELEEVEKRVLALERRLSIARRAQLDFPIIASLHELGNVPTAGVSRATTQSISDNTSTIVSWTVEDWDTDNMFQATDTVLTVRTGGVYVLTALVTFAAAAGYTRQAVIIRVDGVDVGRWESFGTFSSTIGQRASVAATASIKVGSTVTLTVFHAGTGVAQTVTPFLRATMVADIS